MTAPPAGRLRPDSPAFTLAWFAVVLAVVFTTALWLGRAVGPEPDAVDREPAAPHPAGSHP